MASSVLVAALVVGSCGGDEVAEPEWVEELQRDRGGVTIGTGASGTSGTDIDATTVTIDRSDEPPPLRTSGDDFDRVWRDIEAFESWLLAHPERDDLLDEIYVTGGEIHRKTAELLADLRERNAVMEVGDYAILDVRLVERPDADTALVRYTDTRSHRVFVDRGTGEVIDREEFEDQPWTWDLTLERGDDQRWRIGDIVFVEAAD